MFTGITLYERIIIEALENRSKNYDQIKIETCLNDDLLKNCLLQLVGKNIVICDHQTYELNLKNKNNWLPFISEQKNLELEYEEILTKFLEQTMYENRNTLSIKKIICDEKDEMVLNAMLINLDNFVKELNQKKVKNGGTKKKIILWGQSSYEDLLKY